MTHDETHPPLSETTGSPALGSETADSRELHNPLRAAGAILLWAACFTGCSLLIEKGLAGDGIFPWLVGSIPFIPAVMVLLAYARFLREADELQRLIQLQALALGFGGAFFALAGYEIFEKLGAPEAGFSELMVAQAIFYSIGIWVGWRRYR